MGLRSASAALAFAAIASFHTPQTPVEPRPGRLLIDAVVVDRAGMPVLDVKPSELEVWIARVADLSWDYLRCEVSGTLDRQDRVPQFTSFQIRARLGVPTGTSQDKAQSLLEKAERRCLIANSLKAPVLLDATIERADQPKVA